MLWLPPWDARRTPGLRSLPSTGTRDLHVGTDPAGERVGWSLTRGEGHHLTVAGETGMGKSTLLQRLAADAMGDGRTSLIVVDPLGETAQGVLHLLSPAARSRSVWVAPLRSPVGINALELPTGLTGANARAERERRVSELVTALRRVRAERYGETFYWGPRIEDLLTRTFLVLSACPGSTLRDAHELLSEPDRWVGPLSSEDEGGKEALALWESIRREGPEERQGALRIVQEVALSSAISRLLATRAPRWSLSRALEPGAVTFFDLERTAIGVRASSYLGAALLSLLWSFLLARKDRGKVLLILDEVQEYTHAQAVADGVNVDFDVYRIRTDRTVHGGTIDKGAWVEKRDRISRRVRSYHLDEDLTYTPQELDRMVVVKDQLRLVFETFKQKLPTEIFPGRAEVPKTLVYAKDDSHADDIVRTIREVFDKGNEFCQKITYRTTGAKPEDLLQSFRTTFQPRIVVTVDMIATGTDIKPLEIVMFLRGVKSRTYFEQMKGRAVRVISPTDLIAVSGPDAVSKDHFVIVDCVGVCNSDLSDTFSLDQRPGVELERVFESLPALLKKVAFGAEGERVASTLAGKLARLDRRLTDEQRVAVKEVSGGASLQDLAGGLVRALDPQVHAERARAALQLASGATPPEDAVAKVKEEMLREAVKPLAANPALRAKILEVKKRADQTIDSVSQDQLLEAGFSAEAKEKARALVRSFEEFIEKHRDEITALQVLYSKPRGMHLTFEDVKALADTISAPPRQWTPEVLWRAYETLEKDRVRGAGQKRLLTDIVSLVRFALKQEQVLEPFPQHVQERFEEWVKGQERRGKPFTPEQRVWLEMMRDHVASSLQIEADDFDLPPFNQKGGLGKASVVFGKELTKVIEELNGVLAE
ncbi:MAG: hypothetical protein KGJ23_05005 [Euryarchaeota archaeon]|nr:hypothetical protein [Euryarchaeota archaeon]MDE2044365.1 hypothetical protein [Thermoplasmata archaeon]